MFYISKHMKQELRGKVLSQMPSTNSETSHYICFLVHTHVLQKAMRHLFIHCQLNGKSGGHQAWVEHQQVLKALGKDCSEKDGVLAWGMILQGQDMVLVVPRLPVAQCPTEQAVLLTLEEEQWDMALEIDTAY